MAEKLAGGPEKVTKAIHGWLLLFSCMAEKLPGGSENEREPYMAGFFSFHVWPKSFRKGRKMSVSHT